MCISYLGAPRLSRSSCPCFQGLDLFLKRDFVVADGIDLGVQRRRPHVVLALRIFQRVGFLRPCVDVFEPAHQQATASSTHTNTVAGHSYGHVQHSHQHSHGKVSGLVAESTLQLHHRFLGLSPRLRIGITSLPRNASLNHA